jgi:hypothetical protein
MDYISSAVFILGPLAEASLFILFVIMGKRLGQALELPPRYRLYWFAVALFLLPLPLGWILLATKAGGLPQPGEHNVFLIKIFAAMVPTAIGLTLAVFPTAKYWNWIWRELREPGDKGEDSSET